MTERLYYRDPYIRQFTATIVERLLVNNRVAVVLDRSAFYPGGGGQPADRGRLNNAPIVEVAERPADGALVHILGEEVWEDQVRGELDWPRRFDLMQQHTGQHILSQAFVQAAGARTIAFHLSAERMTIDLHKADLTPVQIERAETLANEIVWQNRTVQSSLLDAEQVKALNLRLPANARLPLRLLEVDGFDKQPCAGTHVARTGEVGLIKIVRLDRRGEELRIEFRCGGRALADYRRKNQVANRVAAELSVGLEQFEEAWSGIL